MDVIKYRPQHISTEFVSELQEKFKELELIRGNDFVLIQTEKGCRVTLPIDDNSEFYKVVNPDDSTLQILFFLWLRGRVIDINSSLPLDAWKSTLILETEPRFITDTSRLFAKQYNQGDSTYAFQQSVKRFLNL